MNRVLIVESERQLNQSDVFFQRVYLEMFELCMLYACMYFHLHSTCALKKEEVFCVFFFFSVARIGVGILIMYR